MSEELCRRCGLRPGRERFYNPGTPGEVSFSLAGVTPKFSVKRTVGCDECWAEFGALRETAGYPKPDGDHPPVRSCCGQRHDGAECPDGLVTCQLCFERVPRERLHVLDDGSLEDVCADCAAKEAVVVEAARGQLVPVPTSTSFLGLAPVGYREFDDPWPPPSGRAWKQKLAARRGWHQLTALVRGWLGWGARGEWLVWTAVWLVGLALVVVGGGFDGYVAAAGLVTIGAGGGLFVRWLWEVLS